MGIFTKDIKTMEDMFLHQLEDIYYAEQQLTKAIPKMADMATNSDLKAGLKAHAIETNNQIERLDKVFAKLGHKPKGTDCPAIDGLIKEANQTAGEIDDKAVLDAAIVANSQAVEHYEMSRYGTLRAWAGELGMPDAVALLEATLKEEKATDAALTTLAKSVVNVEAEAAL
jgi:ferritin-like metal-binding protein YciE